MNIMKLLAKSLYVAETCILMTLAGCTSNKPVKDQTFIMTPTRSSQIIREGTENYGLRTLGLHNENLSKTFAFHPEIAESILTQNPGIQSAYVLLTEMNCYLALVPNGRKPNSKALQEILNHNVDKKGNAGFFEEPDMINQVDWISQSGNLPTRMLEAIGRDVAKYMPTNVKMIYVSANPNFVHCLRFYAKEDQLRGDLSMYMNELNMIVERVFPTYE